MRSTLITVIVLALAAIAFFAVSGPAAAHAPCAETFDRPGASDYGRDHIASHTPHGPPDEFHNPGTHRGYSLCIHGPRPK